MRVASGGAPLAVRLFRTIRVCIHVTEGFLTAALVFPWLALVRRQALIRAWSKRLLRMLKVELRIHGLPEGGLRGNLLIVANHISWLDIFVLNTLQPSRFIAKSELRRWPIIGRLITDVGTLFIERDRRRHTHHVKRDAAQALARGDVIAIFPEGTTSDGSMVLPFHSALLQPIVDAGGHVQPVAIRYRKPTGERNDASAYVGDTSLLESFWRITGERTQIVDVYIASQVPAGKRHRRELTRAAEAAIRKALDEAAAGSAPETPADRRA